MNKKIVINVDAVEAVIVLDKKQTDLIKWCKKTSASSILNYLAFWNDKVKEEYAFKSRLEYISKEDFTKGVYFNGGWRNTNEFVLDDHNNVYWNPEVTVRYTSGKVQTYTFKTIDKANAYAEKYISKMTNKLEI